MTLDELLSLSAQEVFELASKHLINQGRASFNRDKGSCAYRENFEPSDSVRCAVGYFIPDELYTPDMEGMSVAALICNFKRHGGDLAKLVSFLDRHEYLLRYLQLAHDYVGNLMRHEDGYPTNRMMYDKEKLRKHLIKVGKGFNLDTSFLSHL